MEWISVKERLPEKGVSVLAVAIYRISPEHDFTSSMYVAWIEGYGLENKPIWEYSWCCGCFCDDPPITHWAFLPKIPSELYPISEGPKNE